MAANGIHFYRVGNVVLPVGFRFRPTGEELICYYLQINLKGMDNVFSDVIPEINICDHEPRDLPGLSLIKSDDQEWYFFSTYKKNSKNQTERMTKEGFWKVTGERKQVKTEDKRSVIGEKRILTFYGGHSRDSQKTDWVMHEYYIPKTNPNDNQRDLVVCCVKKKSGENGNAANCHERESSTYNNNASDFENQQLLATRMDIEEEHTQQQQMNGMQSAFSDENLEELVNSFLVDWDQDAQEMSLQMLSEPPVDSRHPRRQEGVKLCQKQAASSVNVVPNQLVTDEHSDAELPQINCIQLAPEEYYNNERTRRKTYPTSALKALSKQKELKQQQSKAKEVAEHRAAVDFPPKKTSITESNKEAEVAQGNNAEKGMKQTQQQQSMDFFEREKCRMLGLSNDYYNNERTRRKTYPTSALETLSKQKELKQQQSKVKEAAERRAAVDFPPKKTSITESNKEAEVAQGNNAKKGMKQTQNATTAGNWKGCSFISWETLSKKISQLIK
ncbi:NAC domain-containing protein 4-like isoform X4 [Malus domestica]|uniref:NAC domain-containing protein 4-like isoform X4 n=1 Tax=Malus domestica TaxID=3750 RepID=UPI003975BE2E